MQNIIFNIVAKTGEFIAGMKGAGGAVKGVEDGVKKVGDEAEKAGKKVKGAGNDVKSLGEDLKRLAGMVGIGFSVQQVIQFGKEVAKVTAEVESFNIRMKTLHGDTASANDAMSGLRSMAEKYGMELNVLTKNYIQFVSAAKASGVEVSKAEKIFKSMSVAVAGSGGSAQQADRAFMALTQMLGKNKISSEELRQQLGEAMPMAVGIMAKSLGVTTGELEKMMASGQLIASEVLPKFAEEMENALGGNASALAQGLQADINRLSNAWRDLLASLGDSGAVELSVKGLTTALKGLSTIYNSVVYSVALARTAMGDFSMLAELSAKRSADAIAESNNRIIESAEEVASAMVMGWQSQKKSKDEIVKLINSEIKANEKLIIKSDKLTSAEEKHNFMIQANINAMKDELAVYTKAEPVKTKSEAQIKAEAQALQDLINMRRRAMLAQADETSRIRINAQNEIGDLKSSPAFKELDPQEQQALIDNIENTAQAQIDAIIETRTKNEQKAQESLKKLFEFTPKTRKEIEDANTPAMTDDYKKSLKDKEDKKKAEVDAVKDEEEQKKDIRLDIAMQTFDLLSTLNARYAQSQTRALQEQLNQGLISQEAYEAQMRKIKRKQAIIDKSGALFNIGLNTAVNATANPALAPLVIAFGALQAATVIASPVPYNKGTKRVPMMRGAVRGKDSVHAILTPDERVVPADINTMQGYSALMDLAQDRKISDAEAGVIAQIATGGRIGGNNKATNSIDYDLLGKSIAKYIPHTDVSISDKGIAVISERRRNEISRIQSKL